MSAHDILAILMAIVFATTNILGAWFTLKRNNITFSGEQARHLSYVRVSSIVESLENHFLRPIFLWLSAAPETVMGFTESHDEELNGRQLLYIAIRTLLLVLVISILLFCTYRLLLLLS